MVMLISIFTFIYKNFTKRIFFLIDPELFHNFITSMGEIFGKSKIFRDISGKLMAKKYPILKQEIAGIKFDAPLGLAAGYDYEAKIVKVLPSFGFGFNTVGTITNLPYEGNSKPRLGRLPKSKSLMVNKGFKNRGARWTAKKLSNQTFEIPLGISIGATNPGKNAKLSESSSGGQNDAIADILQAFTIFKDLNIKNAYYELNISCPNLYGNISFYPPKNLDELLSAVDGIKLNKPLFIKMPINETDSNTLKMLDVIVRHKVAGVIFGNLQKDRKNPAILKEEIKWKVGNFSGLPTQKRSDELIKLTYKHYKNKLIIIGCGGVFSTEDAYRKIKLGATLVQLITGLIYEGPMLVVKVNKELAENLKKDGYKNISEAIGSQAD